MIRMVGGKPERHPVSKTERSLRREDRSRIFMPQKCLRRKELENVHCAEDIFNKSRSHGRGGGR